MRFSSAVTPSSEGAAPRPSPYIKKIERVQMPNALYHRTEG
jgi:hypothetical protein